MDSYINTTIKSNKMLDKLKEEGRLNTYSEIGCLAKVTDKEALLDYRYAKREKIHKFLFEESFGGPTSPNNATLIAVGLLGLSIVLLCIEDCSCNHKIKSATKEINHNIAEVNPDIDNFTTTAISTSKANGEYFVELFGTAAFQSNVEPVFTQLTYKVDKDWYKTIKKYYKVRYNYEDDENPVKNAPEYLNRMNVDEELSILRKLAEVTKQRYDSINVIGETDEMNTAVESSVGADRLQIVNISKPRVADGYATFYMGVMRDDKLIEFGVEMPATDDIALNPNSVYTRYMAGEGELVKLDEMSFSDYAHQSDNFRTIDFGDNI